jgi:hypothetical protein
LFLLPVATFAQAVLLLIAHARILFQAVATVAATRAKAITDAQVKMISGAAPSPFVPFLPPCFALLMTVMNVEHLVP